MSSVVSKLSSVLVRPSEPVVMTSGSSIQLSPYDKTFVGMTPTGLLVFSEPIHQATERIKTALSQALVHFHLLAGRLVLGGADDGDYIACTSGSDSDGVSFVAATAASLAIKDMKLLDSSLLLPLLEELAVYYPAEGCGSTDPLLLMQVTEFSCGGFVVGVTWNHAAADAAGIGQFVRAVSELARGLSAPSVVPVACDDSLKNTPPVMGALRRIFGSLGQKHELAMLHVTISSDLINSVRDAASSSRRCTVFEAITAVLWKCRLRAIMSDPDAPTALSISVDARRYVGATNGYYRNCTHSQLAVAKCGAVANGPIMDLVKLIQHAKDQIPDSIQRPHLEELEQHKLQSYDLCVVTYWRNLGFEDADFGGGKPAALLSYFRARVGLPANVVTSNGKDGGFNVLSLTVKKEHAHTFLHELANFTAS